MSIPPGHGAPDDLIDANGLALAAAIARAGSLTAAARGLGVTQSALTKQLQRIERRLGVALFVRDMRGVRPTEYGESLLPRARTVQAQLRQAVEALDQMRGRREGQVTVALTHLATLTLLPDVMRRFRADWPDVQVRIAPPPFVAQFAGLREGAPDFAVAPRPARPLGREFATVPLFTSTVVAIARAGHPLSRARTLRELVDADWVLPSLQSTSAHALARAFARARLPGPRVAVACETLTGLELLVGASDLLGLVPLEVHRLRASATGLRELPLELRIDGPSLALIRWKDAQPTPAAAALAALFVTVARESRATRRAAAPAVR
jgi:DNA-binding transcriptional LysR family regulator